MKKIYLVRFKHQNIGGAESYLRRIHEALKARNIEAEILSSSNKKELKPSFLTLSFLKPLLFAKKVCSLYRDKGILFSLERITCADIYRAGDGVHREWVKQKRVHSTFVKHLFSYLKPIDYVYYSLEKQNFLHAKKIIANSNMVKQDILRYFAIKPSKIEVIYNGFDAGVFDKQAAKKKVLGELGLPEEHKIILFVGNGFFRKGVEDFIKIINALNSDDYVALVIGKDRRHHYYQKLAKDNQSIHFLGHRNDVHTFYAASDIFLFPTLYEPFSNATLEAMAYGSVVFTTEKNGVLELIDDKICHITDTESTAENLDRLLNDENGLRALSEKQTKIAAELSIQNNLDKTIRLLETL